MPKWAILHKLVIPKGVEPLIFWMRTRRPGPLDDGTIKISYHKNHLQARVFGDKSVFKRTVLGAVPRVPAHFCHAKASQGHDDGLCNRIQSLFLLQVERMVSAFAGIYRIARLVFGKTYRQGG